MNLTLKILEKLENLSQKYKKNENFRKRLQMLENIIRNIEKQEIRS